MLKQYTEPAKGKIARLFAILLYRMAFLLDTELTAANSEVHVRLIDYNSEGGISSITEEVESLGSWHKYRAPPEAIGKLNAFSCRAIGGLSIEAFLQYNDLLAWNEDCKYFFRNEQRAENSGQEPAWLNKTGRVNTLLSHISVIGFSLGEIELTNLLMKFVRGRGVGPATNDEIRTICSAFVDC